MDKVRLQKFIADCGIASRRRAEEMMLEGRVKVNGMKITELGFKVDDHDNVEVDGVQVRPVSKKLYIMMNKPDGVISTASDDHERTTVIDLISDEIHDRVFPVGRLDMDTEGMLLLTNDGDLTYKLTHPKHNIAKTYVAVIDKPLEPYEIKKLQQGVIVDGVKTSRSEVTVLRDYVDCQEVQIVIHEGRNRQVRKMFEAVGKSVLALKRTKIANLSLGHLPLGRWRHLSNNEINYLMNLKVD